MWKRRAIYSVVVLLFASLAVSLRAGNCPVGSAGSCWAGCIMAPIQYGDVAGVSAESISRQVSRRLTDV